MPEIGQEGQDKLSRAKVLVIGAGGLGCPILQYLTAAGVGTIGVVDFDQVETSNLQRQVLFGVSDLGKNKALVAKEHLLKLNDTIAIHAYPYQLTYQNALDLFLEYDIIVDGSDNFPTRYLVNDASVITGKPLVYGAIFKFEGQVTVFNYKNGPSYRCLFPNPPDQGTIPNCSEIGVLGVLPGIIGSMQANEVLKIILGLGTVLSGTLLLYNTLTTQTNKLSIERSETEIEKIRAQSTTFRDMKMPFYCDADVHDPNIKELLLYSNIQIIDVREYDESPKVVHHGLLQIPLGEIPLRLQELDPQKRKVFFCASGVRSAKAVALLQEQGLSYCYTIKGGVQTLLDHLKNKEHERA
ncbi:MAG: molybdopterin-synthase adenylyltransferase MoeB [Aureisphaera sp.]